MKAENNVSVGKRVCVCVVSHPLILLEGESVIPELGCMQMTNSTTATL